MFGTVLRVSATGAFVLTNEKCYETEMVFIPSKRIDHLSFLSPGSTIYFDDTKVTLSEHINCNDCHKSLQNKRVKCDCDEKRSVTTTGILMKKENRTYLTGLRLKVSLQCGNRTLHSVIFQNSTFHNIFNDYEVGELIYFKAILMKRGDEHDLGTIFHTRKSIFQDTKPALHDLAVSGVEQGAKYATQQVQKRLKPKAKRMKDQLT